MEAGEIVTRLRAVEKELENARSFRHTLRDTQAAQATELAVLHTTLESIQEDLKELKEQGKWTLRGAWALAATFLIFAISLAAVVVSLTQ